jgi:alpha-methylacyl-CoA racemase
VRVDRPPSAAAGLAAPTGGPLQRNRRNVVLDLKDEQDVEALRRLVDHADVLVEGFRPGVMERLGLGPDGCLARNPRLVYGRLTGWGQDGPLARAVGHDIDYLALAGALEPIGPGDGPPTAPLNYVADFGGGAMLLVVGVLAALTERARSGRGQVVDAAMVDGSALMTSLLHGLRAAGLWPGPRGTNMLDGGAPFYGSYATSDGLFMAVGSLEPAFYAALLEGLGLADEARSGALPAQHDVRGWPVLRARFTEVFASRTRSQWSAVFEGTDACVVPVLSPWEAPGHPHNVARDTFVTVDGLVQPAPAPRFSRTPAAHPTAPPTVDAGAAGPSRVTQILADWQA